MNFPGSILVNRTKIRIVIIWAALAFFVVVSFQEMGWAQHVGQQGTEESVQEALLQ